MVDNLSASSTGSAGTPPPAGGPAGPIRTRSVGSLVRRWAFALVAILLLFLLLYRVLGTSEFRGTVQRVYEREGEYRAELRDAAGNVLVVSNHDMYFPHFKLDSADLHAELHAFATKRDLVKAKIWGFRMEWFSVFPNVVDAEFVLSAAERRKQDAENVAEAVLQTLKEKGALKDGADIRHDLIQTVDRALYPAEK